MKIDLHVHSQFSKRPSQWLLQKLGCHECYTEPRQLYNLAKKKGMNLVTITDHNTIAGCLEIAHLPDTFISEEITAYFPEDRCKVHVLAYNLKEQHHGEIQKFRENVYELTTYLNESGIPHALAHPLWSVNGRLTLDHFEKLLLLFKNFELNGSRDLNLNESLKTILAGLTPEFLQRLAEKHGLTPSFPEPWIKHLTGGSDDHSSLNIARMYTEIEGAQNLAEFWRGLENRQARVRGLASSPKTLAHNIYSIAYQFYKSKYRLEEDLESDNLLQFLDKTLHANGNKKKPLFPWLHLPRFPNRTDYRRKTSSRNSLVNLWKNEAIKFLLGDPQINELVRNLPLKALESERQWFRLIKRIAHKFLAQCTQNFLDGLLKAQLINFFHSLTATGAVYFLMMPYFAAFSSFAHDRKFAESIIEHFLKEGRAKKNHQNAIKVAHFTDTFYEINGVALTLQRQVEAAQRHGKSYTIITCDTEARAPGPGIKNFRPISVLSLPEYQEQKLFHPPFLEILHYCYEENFTHLHASTPGPMGLAALAISHLLQLPICGTYHTALPQYSQYLTDDQSIEDFMWKYVLWFYDQMDQIWVPSQSTAKELADKGIRPKKIRLTPRGVDTHRFNPGKRNGFLESRYQLREGIKLLYVGRVSKEKNLPLLGRIFKSLMRQGHNLHLIVVGDGPYFTEMQADLQGTPCIFTGYLAGEDLAAVYASCDLFLFPSTTDTFGNVVLEAQASGLPVIVTDAGGPQENLLPGETGLIVPADDEESFARAILTLVENPPRLKEMGRAARQYGEKRSFEGAFQAAWQIYESWAL